MLNNSIIGRLSDGYIQPINNCLLASVNGRPSSSINIDNRFEYSESNPTGYNNALSNHHNDARWVSAICCPNLTGLGIGYNNISIIHLSGSIAITQLIVNNNPYLKTLDISTNTAVQQFECANDTSLETLILPSSKASYLIFDCGNCQLTSLNLSGSQNMYSLHCNDNPQLTSLNISGAFTTYTGQNGDLNCSYCQISALEITAPTQLTEVLCNDNLLTALDLTGMAGTVNCSNNPTLESLISLDNILQLSASNCALQGDTIGGVNYILTTLDGAGGGGGILDISGGTNAVPTDGGTYNGLTASSSLYSKGWVIKRNY